MYASPASPMARRCLLATTVVASTRRRSSRSGCVRVSPSALPALRLRPILRFTRVLRPTMSRTSSRARRGRRRRRGVPCRRSAWDMAALCRTGWDVLPRHIRPLSGPGPRSGGSRGSYARRSGPPKLSRERRKPRGCEAFEPSAMVLSPPPSADSGGGIRTRDLRVMSPTSYQTAPPRGGNVDSSNARASASRRISRRVRCPRRAGCRGGARPRPARRRRASASSSA
jgi:hypothetical protein